MNDTKTFQKRFKEMDKDKYIKKLERRIHNQRVALRENWMIIEQRMKYRATPLRSMWFDYVIKLSKEVQELRSKKEGER